MSVSVPMTKVERRELPMSEETLRLPWPVRYRFRFLQEEPVLLPRYPGFAWRGMLGHGLRRVACIMGRIRCEGCAMQADCAYSRLFEPGDGPGGEKRYRRRPPPYLLEVEPLADRRQEAGASLWLGITLLDPARDLPFVIQALRRGKWHGGRSGEARFRLEEVLQESRPGSGEWKAVWSLSGEGAGPPGAGSVRLPPPPPGRATVELLTPLRMKRRGRLVRPDRFTEEDFFIQLWRRVHELNHHYGGLEPGLQLSCPRERPRAVPVPEGTVRWQEWTRYSSRQRCHMKMGGLVGRWEPGGQVLKDWWPLLWYGQWVHLGKATSMGFGRYRLVEDRKPVEGGMPHRTG